MPSLPPTVFAAHLGQENLDLWIAPPDPHPPSAQGPRRSATEERVEMTQGKGKIKVAVVGVGNCASALVQGLEFYKDAIPGDSVPGLMHVNLGPYHVSDIEIVTAFDVDGKKVGKDVAEAIFSEPNNTIRFADVPPLGVEVRRGPTLDGLGFFYRQEISESTEEPVDVAAVLRETGAQIVVNYLPVGSEVAAKHYAQAALEAGAGFVNCMPVFIASDREWARRFADAGVPIIGDDIKSQLGSTIVHRVLSKFSGGHPRLSEAARPYECLG